ncbi:MAG: DUF2782 domain-containing protein [Amphritea sp.]
MKKYLLLAVLFFMPLTSPLSIAEPLPEFDENEPTVIIRQSKQATFYEYSINGQLKEIKVVPSVGKPYYLVPTGNGEYDRFDNSSLMIPKWILFSW